MSPPYILGNAVPALVRTSLMFIFLAGVGVAEAFDHAWLEKAFTTNWFAVTFAPYASFYGIPYWVFGVVWFPLIFIVGLWSTHYGKGNLSQRLLVLLTVGNLFTGYLWYVDLVVVSSFTPAYVGLYVTNYALTALVVAQNWQSRAMREFGAGTIIGAVVGVFFGAFGVAFLGITGGILGAIGGYTSSK
jgi:uncharacterized membrane protein